MFKGLYIHLMHFSVKNTSSKRQKECHENLHLWISCILFTKFLYRYLDLMHLTIGFQNKSLILTTKPLFHNHTTQKTHIEPPQNGCKPIQHALKFKSSFQMSCKPLQTCM
jgi:hypothetical protein